MPDGCSSIPRPIRASHRPRTPMINQRLRARGLFPTWLSGPESTLNPLARAIDWPRRKSALCRPGSPSCPRPSDGEAEGLPRGVDAIPKPGTHEV